ncbi:hypothetical protein ACWGDE_22025 [Streptomyces sp. NPDC054956]
MDRTSKQPRDTAEATEGAGAAARRAPGPDGPGNRAVASILGGAGGRGPGGPGPDAPGPDAQGSEAQGPVGSGAGTDTTGGTRASAAAISRLVGMQRLAGNGAVSRALALQRLEPSARPRPRPGSPTGPEAGREARPDHRAGTEAETETGPEGAAGSGARARTGGARTTPPDPPDSSDPAAHGSGSAARHGTPAVPGPRGAHGPETPGRGPAPAPGAAGHGARPGAESAEGQRAAGHRAEDGPVGDTGEAETGEGPAADPGDGDLISTELAEHERWAGSFGSLGTAGSDERAQYLLDMAGQGAASGAAGGAVMGFAMSAIGAAIGQVAGRRLATLAVSRGVSATPVPGLGPAIGGVMALAGLAMRDWGATGQTIGRMGTGTGYERLANDLEGLAEVLDVTMALMDVVAGVLGGIAVGMWVGAVLSGGTLAPLALTLSAVATGMGLATTAVGLVINIGVRPVVTALRALHAFDSQGDPAQIEQQGEQLSSAASQVSGAAVGALAAKAGAWAGTRGGNRIDAGITRLQERATGGAPSGSVTSSGGPRLHVEMPEAPGAAPHVDADAGAGAGATAHVDADSGSGSGSGSGTTTHVDADAGTGTTSHIDTDTGAGSGSSTTTHVDADAGSGSTSHIDTGSGTGTTTHVDADTGPGPTTHVDADGTTPHADAGAGPGGTPHADADPGTAPRTDAGADTRSPGTADGTAARPAPSSPTPLGAADPAPQAAAPAPHAAADPADFSDLDPLIRSLEEDPNVQARLTDDRPELPRRETPWTQPEARAYANEQAADHRAATGMSGDTVQAGHTAAARHAPESGIRPEDWDTQPMQPLHSRRDSDVAATVTHQDGRESTNTRHRAQERLIDAAVAQSRRGSPDGTLTPRGHLDAAAQVAWQSENIPLAQDNIDMLRAGPLAAPGAGPAVDPATGRVIPGTGTGTGTGTQAAAPTATPHSPASPAGTPHTPAAPASSYPDHTRTIPPTQDRAAAMAQYQAQVRADPGRESGVWRDSAGNYHVMQGGPGSVAPPSVSGPLELIYHSHPTTADPAMRSLNSQPSQAGGDFGVLQHQHGEGPAGRRQSSELHFPVYDGDGNQTGYGATGFAYDPTHPLPLHVTTTTPEGGTSTQRYRDFADFQQRARVGASGGTAAERSAAFAGAEARLSADRAAAAARVDATARALDPGPGMVGVREGRERGDTAHGPTAEGGTGAGAGAGAVAEPSRRGPAYTAHVAGLRPGESVDLPVNPAYTAPPGTPAELAALRERLAVTRRAQAELAGTEGRMASQAATQSGQDTQLGRAGEVSQQLVAGGQAQATATRETQSVNREQQSTAAGAIGSLGQSAQQAGAVATLVGSLRAFQGLAGLFGYLPGSLGASARGASADSSRLIAALGRVRETDAVQGQMEGRRSGMEADQARIGGVDERNTRTAGELDRGRQQVEQLRELNRARLGETEATRDQARRERQEAAGDEERTQGTHDDLLARMRTWAGEHRAARETAVAAARAALTARGYAVQESG